MTRNLLLTVAVTGLVAASSFAVAEDVATSQIDAQITQQVQEKLATDEPSLSPHILVSTRGGVVTLAGPGMTPQDIDKAVRDASETAGVVRVDNRLQAG